MKIAIPQRQFKKIVNLTGKEFVYFNDESTEEFNSVGEAKVVLNNTQKHVLQLYTIPLTPSKVITEIDVNVIGLPEPEEGTIYIVNPDVAMAVKLTTQRDDIYILGNPRVYYGKSDGYYSSFGRI